VGPRAALDTVSKSKIPSPRRESNPNPQIVQPVASTDQKAIRLVTVRAAPAKHTHSIVNPHSDMIEENRSYGDVNLVTG
jgi:hypothetical protein